MSDPDDPVPAQDLTQFGVSEDRGFLPAPDPLDSFTEDAHESLQTLDNVAENLPDLLEEDDLRPTVEALDAPPSRTLDELSRRELYHLYSITGFLGSAYVHKRNAETANRIPDGVAIPLYESTQRLDRRPMLSYDGYALHNWRRRDADGPIALENLETITNFVNLRDEEWFIIVHIEIEAEAGPALTAIPTAQQGVHNDNPTQVVTALEQIRDAVAEMVSTLERMPEENDPGVYGFTLRKYIEEFNEVEYEGVSAFDEPQTFRGETGAQSAVLPALDTGLGISHASNPLVDHVEDMRNYMPPHHREFLEAIDAGPSIWKYAAASDNPALRTVYDECLDEIIKFREIHAGYAEEYILEQLGDTYGTGSTPYGNFLANLITDTRNQKFNQT